MRIAGHKLKFSSKMGNMKKNVIFVRVGDLEDCKRQTRQLTKT